MVLDLLVGRYDHVIDFFLSGLLQCLYHPKCQPKIQALLASKSFMCSPVHPAPLRFLPFPSELLCTSTCHIPAIRSATLTGGSSPNCLNTCAFFSGIRFHLIPGCWLNSILSCGRVKRQVTPNYKYRPVLGQTALVCCVSAHSTNLRIDASSPARRMRAVCLFYIDWNMSGESGNNVTETRFDFYMPIFVHGYLC